MADYETYSDIEDDADYITLVFNRATEHVKKLLPDLQPNKLLEIYAFYKQATVGPCNIPRPRFYMAQARAKWDAWHNLNEMPSDEAKQHYVRVISQLDPDFRPEKMDKSESWVTVSSLLNTDAILDETDKTVFDFCKEDNLPQLRDSVGKNGKLLAAKDENGLGLIHWAADRGNLGILEYLVGADVDVNMVDNEGQTALHYATSCDYLACVEVLVNAGADCHACDNDGLKPVDLATDSDILKLLKQSM